MSTREELLAKLKQGLTGGANAAPLTPVPTIPPVAATPATPTDSDFLEWMQKQKEKENPLFATLSGTEHCATPILPVQDRTDAYQPTDGPLVIPVVELPAAVIGIREGDFSKNPMFSLCVVKMRLLDCLGAVSELLESMELRKDEDNA